ncbi:MAG: diphthamide biosynthesis enzyme Dph2 [Conexivisphaerales archaeon]
MSVVVKEESIINILQKERPKRVAFQAPDGLLTYVTKLAEKIRKEYGVDTIIILDPNWGSCDLVNFDVTRLGVDIVFNIGHSLSTERLGKYTYFIDAEYLVDFAPVLQKAMKIFKEKGFKNLGVLTISNHKSQLDKAIRILNENGFNAIKGIAEGALFDGQVFGCNFYSARNISSNVECFVFLGQSKFHAIGINLSTRKPTYMVDPFFNEVIDISRDSVDFEKRAILSILKAKEAQSFGIITSLKEGQYFRMQAEELRKELEALGKTVCMFSLREITPDRLRAVRNIDAFIETACPRISMDNYNFDRPLLSYQQALGLIRILKGLDLGDIFDYSFWV